MKLFLQKLNLLIFTLNEWGFPCSKAELLKGFQMFIYPFKVGFDLLASWGKFLLDYSIKGLFLEQIIQVAKFLQDYLYSFELSLKI